MAARRLRRGGKASLGSCDAGTSERLRVWTRLVEGTRWAWVSEDYRAALPADLPETVMGLESSDRHHAKQGRSTARVRFDSPWGPLSVYLKRHHRLPWPARVGALLFPGGLHTPAAAERARAVSK